MPRVIGYLNPIGRRPYISCWVYLPRFDVGGRIRLLVDTGADRTTLHWGDRLSLANSTGDGLPEDAPFPVTNETSGITTEVMTYGLEDVVYIFTDEAGGFVTITGTISVALDPQTDGIPSLLGRDVIGQGVLLFDDRNDAVVLTFDD